MWKKLKADLSFVQIIAVGLAAGTAWLLSSKIGLTGSVAGVMIGGIVGSTLSTVYKHSIQESREAIAKRVPAKKIKDPLSEGDSTEDVVENNDTNDEELVLETNTNEALPGIMRKTWVFKPSTGIILGAITSFTVTIVIIFFFQLIISSAEDSPYRETIIKEVGGATNNTTIVISPTPMPYEVILVTITPEPPPAVTVTAEPQISPPIIVTAPPSPSAVTVIQPSQQPAVP